jgi:uncharacterized protein (DUF1810 family)
VAPERFIKAQERDYTIALSEIKAGRKRSHWMWYIFPQLHGLGASEMSRYYAIQDFAEAGAHLEHPLLGPRLMEISSALLSLPGNNANAIFGSPDDRKLHSSMTLFSLVNGADPVFDQVIKKYFYGKTDPGTLQLL